MEEKNIELIDSIMEHCESFSFYSFLSHLFFLSLVDSLLSSQHYYNILNVCR